MSEIEITQSAGAINRPVLRYHGGNWMLADWLISRRSKRLLAKGRWKKAVNCT